MPFRIKRKTDKYFVSISIYRTRFEIIFNIFYFSDILRQRTRDIEVKRYCVSLLEKYGSFKYTREVLDSLDKEARLEVARLGPNPIMENLLNELLNWKTSSK